MSTPPLASVLGFLLLLGLGACLPPDRCQREITLCLKRCEGYEPGQTHDPAFKYQPGLKSSPPDDARSGCERSCQRCGNPGPSPKAASPTPTS